MLDISQASRQERRSHSDSPQHIAPLARAALARALLLGRAEQRVLFAVVVKLLGVRVRQPPLLPAPRGELALALVARALECSAGDVVWVRVDVGDVEETAFEFWILAIMRQWDAGRCVWTRRRGSDHRRALEITMQFRNTCTAHLARAGYTPLRLATCSGACSAAAHTSERTAARTETRMA